MDRRSHQRAGSPRQLSRQWLPKRFHRSQNGTALWHANGQIPASKGDPPAVPPAEFEPAISCVKGRADAHDARRRTPRKHTGFGGFAGWIVSGGGECSQGRLGHYWARTNTPHAGVASPPVATLTRTRQRRRRPPKRLGPHPAGIRIVRGYIEQQRRLAAGRDEWTLALRSLEQPTRRRFIDRLQS